MTERKYELTDKTADYFGRTLHRIRATRDIPFHRVEEGDLGGYIESEHNLSQGGSCWVGDEAKVYGRAWVYGRAKVSDSATVSDSAMVHGSTRVSNNAKVYGSAMVHDSATVCDSAIVCGSASVSDSAKVYGGAMVHGEVNVSGESVVCQDHVVCSGYVEDLDLRDTVASLKAQLGVTPVDGEVALYKKVEKVGDGVYRSNFDEDFKYRDGEIAVVEDPDMSNDSCASGIHCGNVLRWDEGDTWIAVRVRTEDIITVQNGKARCERVRVIGEIDGV